MTTITRLEELESAHLELLKEFKEIKLKIITLRADIERDKADKWKIISEVCEKLDQIESKQKTG